MKAVLDTNILVDYLHGIERARSEVDRYDKPAISLITWIEILVGAQNQQEESLLRRFLQRFETLAVSTAQPHGSSSPRSSSRHKMRGLRSGPVSTSITDFWRGSGHSPSHSSSSSSSGRKSPSLRRRPGSPTRALAKSTPRPWAPCGSRKSGGWNKRAGCWCSETGEGARFWQGCLGCPRDRYPAHGASP